jgi:hypothetical protein
MKRLLVPLLLVSVLTLFGPACGASALDEAQTTIAITSTVVGAVDQEVAPIYTEHAEEARAEEVTLAGYLARMHDFDELEQVIRLTRGALATAQSSLDAWRAADDPDGAGFYAAVPCVVLALKQLAQSLSTVQVETPAQLMTALHLAQAFGGACQSPPALETTSAEVRS